MDARSLAGNRNAMFQFVNRVLLEGVKLSKKFVFIDFKAKKAIGNGLHFI